MGKSCSGNPQHRGGNHWSGGLACPRWDSHPDGDSSIPASAVYLSAGWPCPCRGSRWARVPGVLLAIGAEGSQHQPCVMQLRGQNLVTSPAMAREWSRLPCAILLLMFQILLCPKEEFDAYLTEKGNFVFFLISQETKILSNLFQKLLILADIFVIKPRHFKFIISMFFL